jgi:hypothetical protein
MNLCPACALPTHNRISIHGVSIACSTLVVPVIYPRFFPCLAGWVDVGEGIGVIASSSAWIASRRATYSGRAALPDGWSLVSQ